MTHNHCFYETETREAKIFKATQNHSITNCKNYENLSKQPCIKNDRENTIRCYGRRTTYVYNSSSSWASAISDKKTKIVGSLKSWLTENTSQDYHA